MNQTLFKRNKNSTIQQWTVETEIKNGVSQVIIKQGQLNGKLQEYSKAVIKGNQGRTMDEQVEFLAQSLVNKKKDQGYKAIEDLNIQRDFKLNNLCHYNNTSGSLEHILSIALPKYNTDVVGKLKPMLALSIDKIKTLHYPMTGQPKLNGVRCLINEDEAYSRTGKSYNPATVLIRKALEGVFAMFPGITLDGEIYVHGKPLNQITALVKNTKREPQAGELEYHIYDIAGADLPYSQRKQLLHDVIEAIDDFGHIHIVNTLTIYNRNEITHWHNELVSQGYEGLMLRDETANYEFGQRTKSLIKVKQFQEEEFKIVGHLFGERGVQDLVFICKHKDKTFRSTPVGTVAEKQRYVDNMATIIGKMATVRFFEYTEYNVPFHSNLVAIRDYE